MTQRINIRTLNGNKHNPLLPSKFQRIQNRAAAIWDAWEEYGSSFSLDVVAHMHKIPVKQIHNDIYGDPLDIEKRFGIEDSTKLERVLKICLQEIEDGIDSSLVAVANNVPFYLLRQLEDVRDIRIVVNNFLSDMSDKLREIRRKQRQELFESIDHMTSATRTASIISPLRSIENQISMNQSTIYEQSKTTTSMDLVDSSHSSEALSSLTQTIKTPKKRSNIDSLTTTSQLNMATSCRSENQNNILLKSEDVAGNVQSHRLVNDCQSLISLSDDKPLFNKHSIRPYHRASLSCFSNITKWSVVNQLGVGLDNNGRKKNQQNKCYLNSIIQCLANTASFAHWLLSDGGDYRCQLKIDGQFCSVCELRLIFINIHMYANRNTHCDLFSTLSQATAEPLARRINEISSNFVIGQQENPSELFVNLLDHMTKCLSPVNCNLKIDSISTVIQDIFGIQLQSVIVCSKCLNKTSNEICETTWSVPVNSHTTLFQCIAEFCKTELLHGDEAYACEICAERLLATKTYRLRKTSPAVTIHFKRFTFDRQTKTINKIKRFISFPELLDLTPYFDESVQESIKADKENNPLIYELYGVVHLGEEAAERHVYAYIRSPDGF